MEFLLNCKACRLLPLELNAKRVTNGTLYRNLNICYYAAKMQHPPYPDREHEGKDTPGHEVGDLDPAQIAEAQQAEWVASKVEPGAGEHLDHDHNDE